MRIPLIRPDLPPLAAVSASLAEMLESGQVTNFGSQLQAFEREASAYLGCEAVAVSSGTLGLIFALQALGLQRGQKVAIPSFTFMATGQAVLYAGGVPVFVEIGDDLTIDVDDLCSVLARHPDIACILAVHMYGLPCDTERVEATATATHSRQGDRIPVLYDAAHAFGARRDGKPVGGFGAAEVFSLSATKVLVAVEGGMVSSADSTLIQTIRSARNYGIGRPYDATRAGVNGKMSEFHAAIGLYNLRRLDTLMATRRALADYYLQRLATDTAFRTPPQSPSVVHTFKDFTVLMPHGHEGDRGRVAGYLESEGIETRAYFSPPVHRQEYFARFSDRPLPRTDAASASVLTLPFATSMTEAEVDYVVARLARVPQVLGWSPASTDG
jgi:dTDP-4-amino-4,6-dideoxygalactose transaminase